MKCNNCGQEIADDSVFCECCGKQVKVQLKHYFRLLGIIVIVAVVSVFLTLSIAEHPTSTPNVTDKSLVGTVDSMQEVIYQLQREVDSLHIQLKKPCGTKNTTSEKQNVVCGHNAEYWYNKYLETLNPNK